MDSSPVFVPENYQYQPLTSPKSILSNPAESKEFQEKKNSNNAETQKQSYSGLAQLFALRKARREELKGRQVPLLGIIYTTGILQVFIVICITMIISFRKDTEHYFYHISQSFNGIFDLNDDGDNPLLRMSSFVNELQNKFDVFFTLNTDYTDHYFYPNSILQSVKDGEPPKPTATLKFHTVHHINIHKTYKYVLTPDNYSIIANNQSYELISMIQNSHYVTAHFEIQSFSFNNDVRNLWIWYLDYKMLLPDVSELVLTELDVSYDRVHRSVSWWDRDSSAFMGSVIASFGLSTFSVCALMRFGYKNGFLFFTNTESLKKLKWRVLLPISHCLSLVCGIVYLVNLSNVLDLNDKWELRLTLSLSALLSWCMLVFAIQTQGTEYGAFYQTLKISFRPIVEVLITYLPIVMGYVLFGTLMFGIPDGRFMFTTPEYTAKTLYAVWLGDEVLDSFYYAGVGNVIAEIYMYSWGILFIAMVFNIALIIVESNFFETIPQLEMPEDKPGASLRDLQRIAEAKQKDDLERKQTIGSTNDDDDDDGFSDFDRHEKRRRTSLLENNKKAGSEWQLNKIEKKAEVYILKKIDSESPSVSSNNQNLQSIRMNMVASPHSAFRKRSSISPVSPLVYPNTKASQAQALMDDSRVFDFGNVHNHIDVYLHHLETEILNTIGKGLVEKEVAKMISGISDQNVLESINQNVIKYYEDYLTIVQKQMQVYLTRIS